MIITNRGYDLDREPESQRESERESPVRDSLWFALALPSWLWLAVARCHFIQHLMGLNGTELDGPSKSRPCMSESWYIKKLFGHLFADFGTKFGTRSQGVAAAVSLSVNWDLDKPPVGVMSLWSLSEAALARLMKSDGGWDHPAALSSPPNGHTAATSNLPFTRWIPMSNFNVTNGIP